MVVYIVIGSEMEVDRLVRLAMACKRCIYEWIHACMYVYAYLYTYLLTYIHNYLLIQPYTYLCMLIVCVTVRVGGVYGLRWCFYGVFGGAWGEAKRDGD